VIDQMAQGMFETAGDDLPVKVDGKQLEAFVYGFESRHVASTFCSLDSEIMTDGVAGFLGILGFFYSLNVQHNRRQKAERRRSGAFCRPS
jgi:hypothetical protein